uniref:Serine-threonine/tyrosine-protein kinase catalytic domain-containing protein n=1 Tax=Salix viminalis TaxID=40686 RepID=A0A6N2K3B7_SALVM
MSSALGCCCSSFLLDEHHFKGKCHLTEYVGRVNEAVDPMIRGNGGEAIDQQQLEAAIELALRCTSASGEDRPLMIEVAKELQRIERSITAAT